MSPQAPWYVDGLRFECTMCGACCTGAPGYVLYTEEEAARIARRLGVNLETFTEAYTQELGMQIAGRSRSLREVQTEHGYDCVFLDRTTHPGKAVCSLYEDRPTQCRTFPFWPEHVSTPRAWKELGKACEGVGRGPLVPHTHITIEREIHARDRAVGR